MRVADFARRALLLAIRAFRFSLKRLRITTASFAVIPKSTGRCIRQSRYFRPARKQYKEDKPPSSWLHGSAPEHIIMRQAELTFIIFTRGRGYDADTGDMLNARERWITRRASIIAQSARKEACGCRHADS